MMADAAAPQRREGHPRQGIKTYGNVYARRHEGGQRCVMD